MKKFIVALALAGGVAAFAYASLHNRNSDKQAIENNKRKKWKKKNAGKDAFSADAVASYVPSRFTMVWRGGIFFAKYQLHICLHVRVQLQKSSLY